MDHLTELYRHMYDSGYYLFDREIEIDSGRKSAVIKLGQDYGVFIDPQRIETVAEETEIIAHECGHIETGTIYPVNALMDVKAKREYIADKWAVHRLLPKAELDAAVALGYTEIWQLADHLGRTEDFIRRAIEIYQQEGVLEYAQK